MKRRTFIAGLGSAAAWPVVASSAFLPAERLMCMRAHWSDGFLSGWDIPH